jgi:hypothetical protein
MAMYRIMVISQASIRKVLWRQRVVLMRKSGLRSELTVGWWWFENTSAVITDVPPDIVHAVNCWERWAVFFLV